MDGASASEHACPQRSGAGTRCHTRPQRRPHTSCCRLSSSCCYRAACSHAPPSSLALAAQFVAHVPEQRALGDNDISSVDGEPIPLDSRYWYYHGELLQAGALHAAAVALKRRQRGVGGLFSQLTLVAHDLARELRNGMRDRAQLVREMGEAEVAAAQKKEDSGASLAKRPGLSSLDQPPSGQKQKLERLGKKNASSPGGSMGPPFVPRQRRGQPPLPIPSPIVSRLQREPREPAPMVLVGQDTSDDVVSLGSQNGTLERGRRHPRSTRRSLTKDF